MTIVDQKRRIARIYRPEEVQLDSLTPQQQKLIDTLDTGVLSNTFNTFNTFNY